MAVRGPTVLKGSTTSVLTSSQMWYKDMRMRVCLIVGVILLLLIIILPASKCRAVFVFFLGTISTNAYIVLTHKSKK